MVNLYPHEMNCSVFVGVLFITWNTKYNTRTKVSFCPLTPWVWHKISNVYNAPVYSPRVKFEAFWGHTQLINMKLLLTAALWKNTRLTTHNGRSLWVLRSVYFQLNQHFTIKINYKTKFRSLFDFSLFYSCFFFFIQKKTNEKTSQWWFVYNCVTLQKRNSFASLAGKLNLHLSESFLLLLHTLLRTGVRILMLEIFSHCQSSQDDFGAA